MASFQRFTDAIRSGPHYLPELMGHKDQSTQMNFSATGGRKDGNNWHKLLGLKEEKDNIKVKFHYFLNMAINTTFLLLLP